MKKFVSGIIVGALLFTGASVFADSNSLIGQKVQGLFSIEKNGSKVGDAIVINGTAFAPVRTVSDAAGIGLVVEGKKIIIQDKEIEPVLSNTTSVYDQKKLKDIEGYKAGIENGKEYIAKMEDSLQFYKKQLETAVSDYDKRVATESIAELETKLKQERTFLEQAEAKLAELESQT